MGASTETVRRLTDEVLIGANLAVFDDLIADDFVTHDPPPGPSDTREAYRAVMEMIVAGFSDVKKEFDEYLDTNDGRVVQNWSLIGKHTGEAFGVPPTGQTVRVRGIEIFRCSGGKIVEHWGVADLGDFFEKVQASQA